MDLYTTWLGLQLGMYENNPVVRWILAKGGIWFVLFKLLGIVASVAILYVAYPGGSSNWSRVLFYTLIAGIDLYLLYIVANNTHIILRLINK